MHAKMTIDFGLTRQLENVFLFDFPYSNAALELEGAKAE